MGLADFVKNKLQLAPNSITLPLMHLNRLGARVYGSKMLAFRDRLTTIDPEQKLVDMANYAIAHVPYYRKRYSGKAIRTADDFRNTFTLIDKQTVIDNFQDFISDEIGNIPHVSLFTSGTSGQPFEMVMNADRYVTEMAFNTRMLERNGWDYGIRASIRRKRLPEGRSFIVNPATKEIIFDGYRTDQPYIVMMERTLRRHGVKALYGYPSTIVQVLHCFKEYGLDTSFLQFAILSSEAVPKNIYRFIEDELGIKIVTFYGHTEKLIFIEQLDRDRMVIDPAYGYTELIGDDGKPATVPGEQGELVGSTFYNHAMPLLRYRTGDYAVFTGKVLHLDGMDKPLIDGVQGRREKSIIYRIDGTYATATAFEIHDEHHMTFEAVQYVQECRGYLIVLVIKGKNFNPDDEKFMLDHYGHAMRGKEFVEIRYVDRLITQPNGKTLTVVNKTL